MSARASSRNYCARDLKALFGRAASRCSECRRLCHVEATEQDGYVITAKIAHIVASSDDGPRGDSDFPMADRDNYPNLILLCGDCHDKVDGQPNTYTIEYLKRKKQEHEAWVDEQLSEGVAQIGFSELDVLLNALAKQHPEPLTDGFTLSTPKQKLLKNDLSGEVQRLVATGMMRQDDVAGLMSDMAKIDDSFPGRVAARFKDKYAELREGGLYGDSLFYGLLEFASLNNNDIRKQSLGLVVLTHLFVICEVFEP